MALTPLKISAMTAGAALGGTEIIPMVQSANNRYATPATIKNYTMGFALSKTGDIGTGSYTFLGTAHTPIAPDSGTTLHVSNQGAYTRVSFDNYYSDVGGSLFYFRKARGTAASPSSLLTDDQLFNINSAGYKVTGYSAGVAAVYAEAIENWTDTATGSRINFLTCGAGSTALRVPLRIYSDKVRIGDSGVVKLEMGGANTVIDTNRLYNARSYTVATLPTPGTVGRVAWASNCRVFDGAGVQEGAGLGTGGLVTDNGTAWKIAGTNVTAVA